MPEKKQGQQFSFLNSEARLMPDLFLNGIGLASRIDEHVIYKRRQR